MTAKELRDLLYSVDDDSEILLLNVNAPLRSVELVKGRFLKEENGTKNIVLLYGKEGKDNGNQRKN